MQHNLCFRWKHLFFYVKFKKDLKNIFLSESEYVSIIRKENNIMRKLYFFFFIDKFLIFFKTFPHVTVYNLHINLF